MNEDHRSIASKHAEQREQLKNMPLMTTLALKDVIKQIEKENLQVSSVLNESYRQLTKLVDEVRDNKESINFVKDRTERITNQVIEMEKKLIAQQVKSQHSVNSKGKEGEDKLIELLQERLLDRDGYTVEKVSNHSMSCDIIVKRNEYPSIRIESKAIGKENGDKVKSKEVEKFERDLQQMNNHGIFVSLYSGIVGKGNIQIEQLANRKFAIYLGNNQFNMDSIIDMIQLLYKLDSFCCKGEDDSDTKLSSESMYKIQGYVKDYTNKLTQTKTHLKESIALLTEIQLDMIEKVILGQRETQNKEKGVHCDQCGMDFQSIQGLNSHRRKCKPMITLKNK